MLSLTDLLAFNAVLAAALISPGPALLFALRTAVADGRAAGLAAGAGLATVAAGWTLAALLGLESLFTLFPWAYMTLKISGAAYLLYIAWQTWRSARTPVGTSARPRGRAFLDGLLINLGNPKSVLFAAAVLVVIFPRGLGAAEISVIVGNHFAVEVLFYSVFAIVLSGNTARRAYLGAKPVFDRIAALMLGALGLKLLLDR